MNKSIVNMINWKLYVHNNEYNLSGTADNHPRLGKNAYVMYTSDLVDYRLEADILTYETKNTIYHCPLKYMTLCPYENVGFSYKEELVNRINEMSNDLDRIIVASAKLSLEHNRDNGGWLLTEENKESLKKMDFSDDAFLSHIKQLQILGQAEIAEKEREEDERLISFAKQYENCIYMEIFNIDTGNKLAYNLENSIGVIEPSIHLGMFQDSILFVKHIEDESVVDFRYFPRGLGDIMETYMWSDNILRAVIKNECQHIIRFNDEEIEVGETKVFEGKKHQQGCKTLRNIRKVNDL